MASGKLAGTDPGTGRLRELVVMWLLADVVMWSKCQGEGRDTLTF